MAAVFAVLPTAISANAQDDTQVIHLRQDNAQVNFVSKLYELKHVRATDILPFINSAVLRYNANSTVSRVKYAPGENAPDALMVSTGVDFMPYVDSLIEMMDRPGVKDEAGSLLEGTGVCRVAYTPRHRAALEFASLIDMLISSSEGSAYVNSDTNTIFWRDEEFSAKNTLKWVEQLDRPLPQVEVRVNYYEVRDSTLRDIGFDYLAWKNGPGVNLFGVGYNAGALTIDEAFRSVATSAPVIADLASSWSYGGFFTAPQFDMSFIRVLQQSGNANLAAYGSLTMINTPVATNAEYRELRRAQKTNPDTAPYIYRMSMYPEYQNIAKNAEGRSFIGASFAEENSTKRKDPPALDIAISNPIICFPAATGNVDKLGFIPSDAEFYNRKDDLTDSGGVIFTYRFAFKNVVERGATGSELSNETVLSGGVTLGLDHEKILSVYEKENEVTQTIGLPVLCKIPVMKYLFSTTTTIEERTYIVVTAEASLVHPAGRAGDNGANSVSGRVTDRK
ncbi:MAG: hypothetical protein PHI85_06475 [Victivallaceae bacterium]|nr:hypothetical protein [Victivallaceae bacterium]